MIALPGTFVVRERRKSREPGGVEPLTASNFGKMAAARKNAGKNARTDHGGNKAAADWFGKLAAGASALVGSRWAFLLALVTILVWGITGPIYKYSDTWQLVINTGTTIVTFLMVFLIQNTQNRDAKAIHLKLDELICAIDAAKNQMIDIEDLPDSELAAIALNYKNMREAGDAAIKIPAGALPIERKR
jgi:low affinity Fe/Cu permease